MKLKTVICILISILVTGCATTYQSNQASPAGFLGDYAQLKEGRSDQALLVYHHPDVNLLCRKYDKILLEPISIWVKENSSIAEVSEEDRQHLANYLYQSIKNELSNDYMLVAEPGPDVLRIRGAITEAEGSYVVLDTLTSIHPGMVAISGAKQMAAGSGTFVAETAVEFSLEDSVSQDVLIMGVDKRAGGKNWKKKFDTWGKVEAAYDYWADKMRTRLRECRDGNLET